MDNIYAKTVHNEYSTQHELHSITLARGLRERWKLLQQRGPRRSSESFSFNSIFIDKSFINLNYWFDQRHRSWGYSHSGVGTLPAIPATAGRPRILGAPLLETLKYCKFNLRQYINSIIIFFPIQPKTSFGN